VKRTTNCETVSQRRLSLLNRSRKRFRDWYYSRQGYRFDLGFAAVVTLASFLPILIWAPCPLRDLLSQDGTALYGSILSALAALLGFAIAVITIVTGIVSTQPFAKLRASRYYDDFWAAFIWAIRAVGAATFLAFVSLFAGRYEAIRIEVAIVMTALALLSASTLFRSGVTLEALLQNARNAQTPPPPVVVDPHPPFDMGSLDS